MSVETAVQILKADATVTGIVGAGDSAKISPLIKAQNVSPPAVTIQRVSVDPVNHLQGHSGLDSERLQLDIWATTYLQARALATACRSAIQNAGFVMVGEFDNYDPDLDPGLYRITQDYQFWI